MGNRRPIALHDMVGEEIANGSIQDMEAGKSLEGLALRPLEEAILINKVIVSIEEVYKLSMYSIVECEGKVVR